jgi:asparagine synthase (glutamine-hydrolysing)
MCGIWCRVLNGDDADMDRVLTRGFWRLRRRGPDESTLKRYGRVLLGFHRLAIMDPSGPGSDQPFVAERKQGGRHVMVVNGEIYNYRQLQERYALPPGDSDCRVLLQLVCKLGLQRFQDMLRAEIRGEYSFVMVTFDRSGRLERILAARDLIGVRPLYMSEEKLLFSSEIRGAGRDTPVCEFPPGTVRSYTFGDGAKPFETRRPAQVHSFGQWLYGTPEVIGKSAAYHLGRVRQAVVRSVQRRLAADRPLAFLLSGGVDSSLVAAVASMLLGAQRRIQTFCCGMRGGTDLGFAKKVAAHIGSRHTEVLFTPGEGLAAIPDVVGTVESWDTTTVRASTGQYLVGRHIGLRTDCRVVLVGEGPDEVCSSYLFNFSAPTDGRALHQCALDYVRDIHLFDGRRADRCLSRWGLEARIPLLDPEFVHAYWSIPAEWRHPKWKGVEKWWLRQAFEGTGLLPKEVLWRKKEAFSDGVSSTDNSWYSVIQRFAAERNAGEEEKKKKAQGGGSLRAPTAEAEWYRELFCERVGEAHLDVLPRYWMPRWDSEGRLVTGYMDPSARVLSAYAS